ncbi:MAG: portal protein [Burkholderiales bacterium]
MTEETMQQTVPLAPGVFHIPFGKKLHAKIMGEFDKRWKAAKEAQDLRTVKWQESEDTFMMYIPEADLDSVRKGNRRAGKPSYVNLNIPYSYAMLLTSHTYYTSVFLARDPVLQVRGRHGEAQNAEMAMESLLDYQLQAGANTPPLYIWLLDVGKYGHGVLGQYWDKEEITTSQYVEVPETFLGVPIPGKTKKVMQSKTSFGYVGNKLYNIRPHDFYTDPRYPVYRFQDGEFCIVYDKVSWHKLVEGHGQGKYFNLEYVKKGNNFGSEDQDRGSTRVQLPLDGAQVNLYENAPSTVELYEFHWQIIPRDWGLGNSTKPEKWVFTVANKKAIISAQPLGLLHGKFPFDVLQFEIDGYSLQSRGMMEILDPLNKTMEWLVNSHFYNVRASLNNQFVYDPSKIYAKDMESTEPGLMIRLKPAGYGGDVRQMLHQIPVQDVTRSNLSDTDVVGSMAQRIMGVNDNIMGMVNSGGRKTATEVRSSSTFGINRLKTNCEWFSATGFAPMSGKMISSTQQLMDIERQYRIVGDQAQWMGQYINVAPDMIQGAFDFVPVDGTMPVDRFAQANLWQQMFGTMSKVPQIMQGYDVGRIFAFVAQLAGLKNINQFRINVVPDGMTPQGVPVNAGGAMPAGRSNFNEPGQIPGMGSTG